MATQTVCGQSTVSVPANWDYTWCSGSMCSTERLKEEVFEDKTPSWYLTQRLQREVLRKPAVHQKLSQQEQLDLRFLEQSCVIFPWGFLSRRANSLDKPKKTQQEQRLDVPPQCLVLHQVPQHSAEHVPSMGLNRESAEKALIACAKSTQANGLNQHLNN